MALILNSYSISLPLKRSLILQRDSAGVTYMYLYINLIVIMKLRDSACIKNYYTQFLIIYLLL